MDSGSLTVAGTLTFGHNNSGRWSVVDIDGGTLTLADPATDRVAKLPLSALYNQGGSPSLYVVDASGSIALKPVTVKAYESDNVVISDGVDEGAKVVALGVQKLDPAQKVRVVSALSF